MSEIQDNSVAVVQAAQLKFVELMTLSAQAIMQGHEGQPKYLQARRILTVLEAHDYAADMEDAEVEALLYCLYELSELDAIPTIIYSLLGSPLVVQESNSSGGGHIIQNSDIDLAQREKLNFRNGLEALDEGGRTHAQLIGGEYDRIELDTTGANISVNLNSRKQRVFIGSDPITTAKNWIHAGLSAAMEYWSIIEISGEIVGASHDITFEENVFMNDVDMRWTSATKVWRPAIAGRYKIHALYDGESWDIDIDGPRN